MVGRQFVNIPIEILRTVEAIVRTGSFTKAAEQLGITQPAISSQMKRIQTIVGGQLFEKTSGGTTLTERGKLVVDHAQKILESNDQLVRLGGAFASTPAVRLGITQLYASHLLASDILDHFPNVIPHVERSKQILDGIFSGYLDLGFLPVDGERPAHIIGEFSEPSVWVRSSNYVVKPGSPIPIITSPESVYGEKAIRTLTQHQMSYRIAVLCNDYSTKMSAVANGRGISAMPERLVPSTLVVAKEYYLPPLEPLTIVLCARSGFDVSNVKQLITALGKLLPGNQFVALQKKAS